MSLADPVDPIENLEHAVSVVRTVVKGDRKRLIREILRGRIDYSSAVGRTIGSRRALLCTRLREEDLWC